MIGVFAATDVFLFYVFFEVMLVPMYFLIGRFGGPRRQYAAVKFFLYSLVGGLFMLAAVIGLYVDRRQPGTFAFGAADRLDVADDADAEAGCSSASSSRSRSRRRSCRSTPGCPTPVPRRRSARAALLVGVLDKVGTFGFLRYCLPLFPRRVAVLRAAGAGAGGGRHPLRGAARGRAERHEAARRLHLDRALRLHRRSASSPSPPRRGTGAVLYMVNHGLATGLLFLVVGMLIARGGVAHDRRLRRRRQGRCRCWPGCSCSPVSPSLALPGTQPFVSEFLVLIGTFTREQGGARSSPPPASSSPRCYVLWMYQRTMQGTPNPALAEGRRRCASDLSRARGVSWSRPLIALILVLGFYPKPVLDVINPAVAATLHDVGQTDPAPGRSGDRSRRRQVTSPPLAAD